MRCCNGRLVGMGLVRVGLVRMVVMMARLMV